MLFNVNTLVLLSAAASLLTLSAAYPALNDLGNAASYPSHTDLEPLEEVHYRVRRASCDLFSFSTPWFTANNAVCAGHCIALGNRGGKCEGTVCHCRA